METKETKKVCEMQDIEDIRILINIKGKHHPIVAKEEFKEGELLIKKAMVEPLLAFFEIVDVPLEDLKQELKKRKLKNSEKGL